jgi:hypothetical protein
MIPLQTDSLSVGGPPTFDQHPLEMDWTAFYLAKEELEPVDQYHNPTLDGSCLDQYDRSIEYGQANVYDEPDNDTTLQGLPCSPAMRLPPMSTREHCPVNPLPTDLRLDRSFVNFDSSPRAMTCDPSLLLAETQLSDRDFNPSGYKMNEDQVHAGRRLEPFGGMASVPNATTVPGYHSHYSGIRSITLGLLRLQRISSRLNRIHCWKTYAPDQKLPRKQSSVSVGRGGITFLRKVIHIGLIR